MRRRKSKSKLIRRVFTVLLSAIATACLAVVIGWLVDDVAFAPDLPRGVRVGDTDIGATSFTTATRRLGESSLGGTNIELTWAGHSLESTAAELGVSIDTEATVELADDRGSGLARPISWFESLFNERTIQPILSIDKSTLRDLFTTGEGSAFGVEFGLPVVELRAGKFVATSSATIPQANEMRLQSLVIQTVLAADSGPRSIEVPTLGDLLVDNADSELADAANKLTDGGIDVSLIGAANSYHIPQQTLRSWIVFTGTRQQPEIVIDSDAVMGVLTSLFTGFGETSEQPTFVVDNIAGPRIVGGAPGSICCEVDTPEKILAAVRAGDDTVKLRLQEDPDARGTAWAESLGITELVGEFTTNFTPGQTRVTNIERITQLTQGALIEPGDTFSINEFVGRRTRANGFVSAGVISNGVYDSSVGGGISQFATTLFNAAFFAGLDFGEYQSHSIYISRYPYGREATMSYPHPDLQIVNNTPYGILLWPTTTDGSITMSLYSTKWVSGEQTGQTERKEGVSCTRVTTQRTRTWQDDGHTEIDAVTARYRPVGTACDGSSSVPTTTTTTTTTTMPTTTTTTTMPTTTTTTTTAGAGS